MLAVRFGDRVGKGIRTAPRDALIADSVDPEHRGAAFGYHRAADHAGAVLGPLAAAAVLLWKPGEYRLVFALAAVPALLSVLVLAARVRDVGEGPPPAKAQFRGFRGLGRRFYFFLGDRSACSRWATRPTRSCCCARSSSACRSR